MERLGEGEGRGGKGKDEENHCPSLQFYNMVTSLAAEVTSQRHGQEGFMLIVDVVSCGNRVVVPLNDVAIVAFRPNDRSR